MKEKILYHGIPIVGRMPLFNAEMRQAVRDDRKGQTRRPLEPQPDEVTADILQPYVWYAADKGDFAGDVDRPLKCPWTVGDVRCMCEPLMRGAGGLAYYRDVGPNHFLDPSCDAPVISLITGKPIVWRWKRDTLTSIHMPTEAARTILKLTDIRVERIQDISEEDVQAEGCTGSPLGMKADAMLFPTFWNAIYAKPRPIRHAKEIVAYESHPWSEETRDPRTTINGKPHRCCPNPHVWVNVFEKVV